MKDLVATLATTPDRVRSLVAGLSEEALSYAPGPEVFSLRENVAHLRDVDLLGYERRIARTLDEDHPLLPDVNGAQLAIGGDYKHQDVAAAVEALAASRARTMARLRDADLDRTAELEGVGEVTLRRLLERWIEHDAEHLRDMETCTFAGPTSPQRTVTMLSRSMTMRRTMPTRR